MRETKTTLDFIVIGAQKAGTTSLFEYLRGHPQLHLPPGKEAPYFSHDSVLARGWETYMDKTFASADPMLKWGTATPSYMVGGVYDAAIAMSVSGRADGRYDERTVPLRIHEQLPDVRLVAILRDPVERAYSHHRMALMNGEERRSFGQAVDELLHPSSLEKARRHPSNTTGYVTWGEYGRIMAGYFEVFPREQILVVFTEELERDPEQLLLRVYEFLGISSDFVPDNLGTRYRVGGTNRRLSWSWLRAGEARRALVRNPAVRFLWRSLPDAVRRPIDRGFERAVYKVDLWNRRKSADVYDPAAATRGRLRAHFAQDADQLAALLGVVPPWQTPTSVEAPTSVR
jgi:Sulfotransferase family